jgi:hypothetical protein
MRRPHHQDAWDTSQKTISRSASASVTASAAHTPKALQPSCSDPCTKLHDGECRTCMRIVNRPRQPLHNPQQQHNMSFRCHRQHPLPCSRCANKAPATRRKQTKQETNTCGTIGVPLPLSHNRAPPIPLAPEREPGSSEWVTAITMCAPPPTHPGLTRHDTHTHTGRRQHLLPHVKQRVEDCR